MSPPVLLAALTLLLWLGTAWEVLRGQRRLFRLAKSGEPAPRTPWPRVSIVVAARNEAATLGPALATMLALDYPSLEIVAVNDRSEDGTGAVLDQLAATDPRLRVVHVTALPAGWLGKTHALHHGAARATGDWILFTDADIHLAPATLRLAVARAESKHLDHLSALPQLHQSGHLLGIGVAAFSLIFTLFIRPWRITDPHSSCHGGVGAFNLVRASAYRRLGGHAPLRLRPDDDVKLGKLMKSGGPSEMVLGTGAVSVAWYATVGQLVRGLTKNAYAGTDYRAWLLLGGIAAHLLFFVGPVLGLGLTAGPALWLNAAAVTLMLALAADHQGFTGGRRWHALFLPAGILILDYALLRSLVVTLATRGITWRGTHYPLQELRKNRL